MTNSQPQGVFIGEGGDIIFQIQIFVVVDNFNPVCVLQLPNHLVPFSLDKACIGLSDGHLWLQRPSKFHADGAGGSRVCLKHVCAAHQARIRKGLFPVPVNE
eukprot:EG_transcript_41037